jgi:glycosyltransferase involved in cell wall biosynthesis
MLDADYMQITCLVKHWHHHTASGGYDQLGRAVRANVIDRQAFDGILGRVAQKIWRRQAKTDPYLLDYQFGDWLAEMRVLGIGLLRLPEIVHVLYGDEQLDQLLRRRNLVRCPLVATFHLPSPYVAKRFEVFHRELVHRIDAAIVLARDQIEPFERWIGPDKVVFVPHGIDADRFRPKERTSGGKRLRLLIVGQNFRDWNVMHRTIDAANQLRLPADFHVVTKPEHFAYFTGCANTYFHSNISEAELITQYGDADALLLPVYDATANNSVLEALACGTPVISTAVGGIPDYVDETCGWLLPKGEAGPVVELVKRLCEQRDILESRRHAARIQALKFDWSRIAERMFAVYAAVSSGRSPTRAMTEFEAAPTNRHPVVREAT